MHASIRSGMRMLMHTSKRTHGLLAASMRRYLLLTTYYLLLMAFGCKYAPHAHECEYTYEHAGERARVSMQTPAWVGLHLTVVAPGDEVSIPRPLYYSACTSLCTALFNWS